MTLSKQINISFWLFASLATLGACGDSAEAPTSGTEVVEAAPEAPPQKIDIASIRTRAKTAMFVPAPTEFQAALKASGVNADLSSKVRVDERSLEGKGTAVVALIAGVRVSNVLLTVPTAGKEMNLSNMKGAQTALAGVQLSEKLRTEFGQAISEYEAGHLSAAEMTSLMDVYSSKLQSDLEASAGEQIATLVRAGGWVQMANLLSRTLQEEQQAGDAALLLRQPSLLLFFLEFIKASPDAQAGDESVLTVISEMEKLMTVAQKEILSNDDIAKIVTHTDAILAQF
jgi:hypothetical protein